MAAIAAAGRESDATTASISATTETAGHLAETLRAAGIDDRAASAEEALAHLEEAQGIQAQIKQNLEAAQAKAELLRGDGGGSATGRRGVAAPAADRPAIPGFTIKRPVSDCVKAIKREGWPRNASGNASARGHLYDEQGRLLNTEVLRPYRKGEAPPYRDLKEPWASDPEYTTTWHGKRDAAKTMRDNGLSHAALYLNVPTCGK